jgi:hypothetical protein
MKDILRDATRFIATGADVSEVISDILNEVSPPGWHGTVRAMKTHKKAASKIDNPYALSWWMKNKGAKPHYKDQPTSLKGKAEPKAKYKKEKEGKKVKFPKKKRRLAASLE